jgi:solute carrier family 25 oxoglutarate transporter 11
MRLMASAVCGVAITVVSLPFDNVRTKMMRMKKGSWWVNVDNNGRYPYTGLVDCFRKSVSN